MDLDGIYRRVKRLTGDDTGLLVTSADILDWVNDGLIQIARRTSALQEVATQAVAANDDEYTLESDFYSIERVTFNGTKLTPTTLRDVDLRDANRDAGTGTGVPTHFYIWNKNIYLYPKPNAAGTLKVWQNILPVAIGSYVAGTVPGIPVEYHEALVDFCVMKAKEREEDYAVAERYEAKFVAQSEDMLSDDEGRSVESYPSVRLFPGDE